MIFCLDDSADLRWLSMEETGGASSSGVDDGAVLVLVRAFLLGRSAELEATKESSSEDEEATEEESLSELDMVMAGNVIESKNVISLPTVYGTTSSSTTDTSLEY